MGKFKVIEGGMPKAPKQEFSEASTIAGFMDHAIAPLSPAEFYKVQPTEDLERHEVELAQETLLDEARRDNLHIIRAEGGQA